MSTLKVNNIEPYSGGTVTITGASIDSASYAETANTLTAGNKVINGVLTVNENDILQESTTGNFVRFTQNPAFFSEAYGTTQGWGATLGRVNLILAEKTESKVELNTWEGAYDNDLKIIVDSVGAKFSDWVLPSYTDTVWLDVPQQGTPAFKRGLNVTGSIDLASGGISTSITNSAINVTSGPNISTINPGNIRVDEGFIVLESAGTNTVRYRANADFGTEGYGIDLAWRPALSKTTMTLAEGSVAEILLNGWDALGTYDSAMNIQSNAAGVDFNDWLLPSYTYTTWLNIPNQGTPSFKRGLDVQGGTFSLPGLGDYADDAAAALGGVPVDGVYRTGSVLKVRVS